MSNEDKGAAPGTGAKAEGKIKGGRFVLPISTQGVNVSVLERGVSALGGGILLLSGLRRGSLGGLVRALLGGALVARGLSGHSRPYQWLGIDTASGRFPGVRSGGELARLQAETAPPAQVEPGLVQHSITIGRSPQELFDFWMVPDNQARIMEHFANVKAEADGKAHWTVRAPLGRSVEWDTHIVEQKRGELVRWEPISGAKLGGGEVQFRSAPGDRGTEVSLKVRVELPGGAVGEAVAGAVGLGPDMIAHKALRSFKSLVETGEIPTLDGNVSARGTSDSF